MSDNAIWGIVLAAGQSTRMGRQKLTLPLDDGRPMVRAVLETASNSQLNTVIVVVSSNDEEVIQVTQVTKAQPWSQVLNPDAAKGMSTSFIAGIRAAQEGGAGAVLVLLGDQPDITTLHINSLINAFRRNPAPVVQASYNGTPSHPILFSQKLFGELLQVTGDEGGRQIVRKHQAERQLVEFAGSVPVDLDTPDAYATWLQAHKSK